MVGIFSGLAVLITSVLKVISNIHYFFLWICLNSQKTSFFSKFMIFVNWVYTLNRTLFFRWGEYTACINLFIYYSSSFLNHAWFYLYVIRKLCHCPLDGEIFCDFHRIGISLKTQMLILSKKDIDKHPSFYFHHGIKMSTYFWILEF